MPPLPDREEQIVRAHSAIIVAATAAAGGNPAARASLDEALNTMERQQRQPLARAIRGILTGARELAGLTSGMDDDDRIVVEAILRGLRDPATLPDPAATADASAAAPGLAALVHGAATGNAQALHALSHMADQMSQVGGDMARLGGLLRRLVNGERDAERLCQRMGALGRSLVLSILDELGRLERH